MYSNVKHKNIVIFYRSKRFDVVKNYYIFHINEIKTHSRNLMRPPAVFPPFIESNDGVDLVNDSLDGENHIAIH